MTNYKKHLLVYFFISAIIFSFFLHFKFFINPEILLTSFFVGMAYTFLPDIDVPSSKIRVIVTKISLAAILVALLLYAFYIPNKTLIFISIFLAVLLYLLEFTKHRGFFHSILAGIFLSAPFYFISLYSFIFAMLGFISHILADRI